MRKIILIFSLIVVSIHFLGWWWLSTEKTPKEKAYSTVLQNSSTPFGQKGEWNLIFNDEFDGASVDPNKWTTCYWWGDNGCTISSNYELQWYQPDDVLVKDGILELRAKKKKIKVDTKKTPGYTIYDYSSGLISTGRDSSNKEKSVRFSFQYGYAEIRAKIPRGKGLWPAFWMLPEDHNSKPEIDVIEVYGDNPDVIKMTFHFINSGGRPSRKKYSWKGSDFSDDFHNFAVNWQPDAIIWYIDGIERWRYTDAGHIPNEPMYLLLNLAVGGIGPGAPDTSTSFPSYFEIDYVRVWKKAQHGHPRLMVNPISERK